MTTFGISAYLKLVSLAPNAQKSEINKRLSPKDSPYDYHRRLKQLIRQLTNNRRTLPEILTDILTIKNPPERQSATDGIKKLVEWRKSNPGRISQTNSAIYRSPNQIFSVNFTPDFLIDLAGENVAVHVWNTKKPRLDLRMSFGALSLFRALYANREDPPHDLAILNLRDSTLHRLAGVADHSAIGLSTVASVESIFQQIIADSRSGISRTEHPQAPSIPL
ncbi:hypothetical protein [Rhizobium changzhiense]|uniref:Uncharacterized protein n=1 Tax=Rhizobium changzhiense TaxID=2692317 RepID=A0ABR6AH29_9HYPH|nr:hypothetical protein [Rhizobium changzhiense]MBA5805774.1 hypothetical protein [Rhizobium changzhiense]